MTELHATPRPGERLILVILGCFMMMAPASIDMYLPALPVLAHDLHASAAQAQLSLSCFLLGFGLGQLFWGPMSDRFGRRGPLAAGITLFILASFACGAARSIDQLMAARFVQAASGCAMPVIAQAIARDVWGRERSTHALSIMMMMMAIAPLMAPMVGAQVLRFAGWRSIFRLTAAFGALALAGLRALPETRGPEARSGLSAKAVAGGYLHLLRDTRYLGYVLTAGTIWGAAFAYVTGTPLVYIEYFGLSPQTFSLLFALNVVGLMSMTFANVRLSATHHADSLLHVGVVGCALATCALALAACAGKLTLAGLIVLLLAFMSMRGFVNANAVAGALANHPERAGAAAALSGTLQFAFGALAGAMLSVLSDGTPRPMLLVMAGFALCALLLKFTLLRGADRRQQDTDCSA